MIPFTLLETIANHVNKANDELYKEYKAQSLPKFDISRKIQKEIDIQKYCMEPLKNGTADMCFVAC